MRVCQTSSKRRHAFAARGGALLALLLLWTGHAHAERVEQLSPQGYVSDFAGVLNEATEQALVSVGTEIDQKTQAQIAVVTIHSLEGSTAQDFANRLFQKWGVGSKGMDRGVLFLLAVDDRQYWTEVGYGLEPILPDGRVGGFGRQMLPALRQGQYDRAVWQITSQIAEVIAQDRGVTLNQPLAAAPAVDQRNDGTPFGIPQQLIGPLVFLLFFGGWRILGLFLGLAGLTRPRRGRGSGGGWWVGPMGGYGGGRGGGSWGGGGFGGFGGGRSGGGGAGGGW